MTWKGIFHGVRDKMPFLPMSLRSRIRTLFRLFLLLAVLMAVALISAVTTIRLTIRGHQETMPKLVGTQLEAAQRLATSLGLDVKVEDKVFSTQYVDGEIVSQVPSPGTRIKMGQHIHVLVSLGAPRVAVPDLVGASERAAKISAIQRGLTLGDIAIVHAPGAESDQVLAQEPGASSTEVRSPAVNLLVSAGEAPPAYLCPDFIGQPLAKVQAVLQQGGFKLGETTPIVGDPSLKDVILAQSPPPGSKITPDTVFSFQVVQ
jgi:beta-lactam-binding protein with PASTA domain